jgi:YHS domain-containing protein
VRAGLLAAALALAAGLPARVAPNLDHGLALQGYDPVAYVDEGRALTGSAQISAQAGGATYRFASAAHCAAFKRAPGRYEPAYGGWCAYAMSRGELVEVDPTNFKVVNGRLMLFFKSFFVDTLKKWNAQQDLLLKAADASWKRLDEGGAGGP